MLNSFHVKNFRLFENLEVKNLNRVNLMVGRNNAGKSTFLEALEVYISNAAPAVIRDLVESRQETWFSEAQRQSQSFVSHSVRHLFFGHQLPQPGEEGILLGELSANEKLLIATAAYQNKSDDEGTVRSIRVPSSQLSLLDEEILNIELCLVAEEGDKIKKIFQLDREFSLERNYRFRIVYDQIEEYKATWQIIKTENMSSRKLAALWDLTSLTELELEVISALRLIDDRVSGVTFVADVSQKISPVENRIPLVKLSGINEPLPLKSMGDGMTRLFHIILALVNAKDGFLLIDEFENGLHWTVQPRVWKLVFQLAEKLNVQVFATTHSRDCIAGFDQAWNQYCDRGAFFRFDVKDGQIKATEYTSETLTDAIEMDVEVR